ncbi:hypothetical protein [Pseudothioclava arenosa]|uniref:DUF4189 domain-containing protein n=1 Tax=Pseudothioclava arenosa TaxID=1795308 RepID=A0A2A4CV01_9RHOB|nr:hypothetical protein [Pseudothioclava arenosa]PCD77914.1 hypothetical protein CLN94_00945 [Pseudothioclava arenosa]
MIRKMCLSAVLAVGLSAVSGADAFAQDPSVQTFGAGHKFVLHSEMELSRVQSAALRRFRGKTGYFAAIAYHPVDTVDFWVWNIHSLETARRMAVGGCEAIAKDKNEDPKLCKLYASVIPKGLDPYEQKASGLSEAGLKELTGPYRRKQEAGRYGAFAISGMGDWGYTWNRRNKEDAIGSAIASCEAAADNAIAGWSVETRKKVNRAKLNTCKVIHVTIP